MIKGREAGELLKNSTALRKCVSQTHHVGNPFAAAIYFLIRWRKKPTSVNVCEGNKTHGQHTVVDNDPVGKDHHMDETLPTALVKNPSLILQ